MGDFMKEVFEKLNACNIDYAVLRGYLPEEELETSADIDIYVPTRNLSSVKEVLESFGFKTPRINACRYPHVQYFLLTKERLLKIDIVTALCFGENLLTYNEEEQLVQYIEKRNYIKTFRSDKALELFMLHIIYDKEKLSKHNYERLNRFLEECKKNQLSFGYMTEEICEFYKFIQNNADMECLNQKVQQMLNKQVGKGVVLKELHNRKKLSRLTNRNVKWRYRLHRIPRKSIAILGVDGSGKSTLVQALKQLLDEKCCVQYMGFREMETFWGKEYYASGKRFKFKLMPFIGVYIEMWYRYIKNRFHNYRIVLYDRFPWEAYDNAFGKYKVIYFILFKMFFPRPKKVYYLYCSVETSLKRKDDILNKEIFVNMKKRFDKKYKNQKSIKSFDTDECTTEEILEIICSDIMDSGFYEYLF